MVTEPLQVLCCDRQVLVINKPPGILSQRDGSGDISILELAHRLLVEMAEVAGAAASGESPLPRNPFVAPVHRLDRPVSGALLLARSSKSARRLAEQLQDGRVRKGYLAVVAGLPADGRRVTLWVRKREQGNRVDWNEHPFPGARTAETFVQPLAARDGFGLVALFPITGRSHQLRVTMASLGCPIVGDLRYGSGPGLGTFIALHAHRLSFCHPISGNPYRVLAPVPPAWLAHWPWLAEVLPPGLLPLNPQPATISPVGP